MINFVETTLLKFQLAFFLILLVCSYASAQKVVAILGSGTAGLSVAHSIHLKHPEASVLVFEKESKAGGNAQTVTVLNKEGNSVQIDLGAQYFAVPKWNVFTQFVNEVLGPKAYKSESVKNSLHIQQEGKNKPLLITPLGARLRGEKVKNLLQFKRFNDAAYNMFRNKVKRSFVTVEQWVNSLDFEQDYQVRVIYPFLASTMGVSIQQVKSFSAREVVNMFAFRKPKASNKFHVVVGGMGRLLESCAAQLEKSGVQFNYNSCIQSLEKKADKWLVHYRVAGVEKVQWVDFVVLAMHADQAMKIMEDEKSFETIHSKLKHLTYYEVKIALHTDATYVDLKKPAFLTVNCNSDFSNVASTMNLGMISKRLKGYYKSWVNDQELQRLQSSGKLIQSGTFWLPYLSLDFSKNLQEVNAEFAHFNNVAFAGAWTAGFDTQYNAVVSGKRAAEKCDEFLKIK